MPVINLEHFEKLQVGNQNAVIGITQSDAFGIVKNMTYLTDLQTVSSDVDIQLQRPLYHTELAVGDGDSGNLPSEDRTEPVGTTTPYKRVFYNLYDVKDTASKTRMEGRVGNVPMWQLDSNTHHDNYAPVMSADPLGFTGVGKNMFMLAKPTKESPLIKTTDLLFNRSEMLAEDSGKVTTTEWCYQLSSSTPDTYIPTYGYTPLSDLVYPSRYVPISSLYIRIGMKDLCSAITKTNATMLVAAVSSKINAEGCADWQMNELTSIFGENWQHGIVDEFGLCCLCDFYYLARHDNGASYEDYIRDMGGDPGISVLQVNKYDFSKMDYNYIYWNIMEEYNQYSAGEMWFDLLYGKNSYTARYSQQFAPDKHPELVSPGNFNRARAYSGIGVGGCVPFLTYYDDMKYEADGDKTGVVAKPSDFSTVEAHEIKEGDEPRLNTLKHGVDYSSSESVRTRGYPHIEQIRQVNIMANQSMHPSNLYKIELHQQYLNTLLTGIRRQKNGDTIASELQTDIKNSIRSIAKKFAPATTELLTVKFS